VDVTDTPYCLVNLGGLKLSKSLRQGGRLQTGHGTRQGFYHAHWYKYPLMYWLNLLTDLGCQEGGDLDVLWMTELDPSWEDSSLAMVTHPDAALFANPIAQMACAADSTSSVTLKKPLDALFWCAGSQGSHYPLTGQIIAPNSPVQMAFLLAQRLNFKLHRFFMITDSVGVDHMTCMPTHYPVTPKSRYRYELVNPIADGTHCYPSGYASLLLESGKINPNQMDQYGFLVWRKRNCTFL
jgi:conjugal transfer pilus assembly protein TraU